MLVRLLLFVVLGTVFFVLGCSRGVVVYNFADNIIAWEVDDFLDLTSAQKKVLKESLREDLDRAKDTLLPEMTSFLEKTVAEVDDVKMTPEFSIQKMAEAQKLFKKVIAHFAVTTVALAEDLKAEQMEYFKKTLEEGNKDLLKKNKDPQSSLMSSMERYEKGFKLWFSDLTASQERLLEEFLKANPSPWEHKIQNRIAFAEKMNNAFPDKKARKALVQEMMLDYRAVRTPEYDKAMEEHQKALAVFMVEKFWPSLSARQKKNLKKELNSRIAQLRQIRESK